MKLTASSALPEVAVAVGSQLRRRGVTAVLTGGACVAVYRDGSYVSKDADFVIQGRTQQATLAVRVARHQRVGMDEIRAWSRAEASLDGFDEFLRELTRAT